MGALDKTVGNGGLEESGLATHLAPIPPIHLPTHSLFDLLLPCESGQAVSGWSPGWMQGYQGGDRLGLKGLSPAISEQCRQPCLGEQCSRLSGSSSLPVIVPAPAGDRKKLCG